MSKTNPKSQQPYFTTYPVPRWYWFDDFIYKKFGKVGNLPTEIFNKLSMGELNGAYRCYKTEEEALLDYKKAKL